MLINLRNALMAGKRTPTAKDYVQSGLVAMWDGIENAGWGTHDASTGRVVDLMGGEPFVLDGNGSITDKSLAFNGKSATCNRTISTFGTVECAFKLTSGRIVFYGCTKYQTSDTSNDFFGIYTSGSGGMFEMCMPNNDIFAYNPAYRLGNHATIVRSGEDAYKDGLITTAKISKNTWGNQAVINIGGRVSTTSYDGAGELYAIRVYSRTLTASEIAANYAIDKARFGLP